ncbi:MAG TPA: hypothetical protein VHS99_11700, partial [Chloroflexota bacterium]|nr:hypothetical protein [Chloroflexota bacterium]
HAIPGKAGTAAVAGRRSGASEEKEGERGLVHTQHRVLLDHDVLRGAPRLHEIKIAERAMERAAAPPRRPLPQHRKFQLVHRMQATRPRLL